jgi:hypothetical protein
LNCRNTKPPLKFSGGYFQKKIAFPVKIRYDVRKWEKRGDFVDLQCAHAGHYRYSGQQRGCGMLYFQRIAGV